MYLHVRSQVAAAERQSERKVVRTMTEQTNQDRMKHMFLKTFQWITQRTTTGEIQDENIVSTAIMILTKTERMGGRGRTDTWGRGKGACDELDAERGPDYRVDSLICDENGIKTNIHIYISLYIQQTQAQQWFLLRESARQLRLCSFVAF